MVPLALWPRSDTADVVVTGILLSLVRTWGVKQNVCCVKSSISRIVFGSCSYLHDMTNFMTESPKWNTAAGVASNTALVCTMLCTGVGNGCTIMLCTGIGHGCTTTLCTGVGKWLHHHATCRYRAWLHHHAMYRCREMAAPSCYVQV